MLKIAITGGIGSGKSTVCSYLEKEGYRLIYADRMAREITASGGKAIPYIREHFGDEYILPDGSMDRAAIRELVYRDSEAMQILEEGTTKVVIEDIRQITEQSEAEGLPVLFFEIPLLFEQGRQDQYDSCWLVSAPMDIKIQRVMKRDGLSEGDVQLIIKKQLDDKIKLAIADEVIYNNKGLEELFPQIDKLLEKYGIR